MHMLFIVFLVLFSVVTTFSNFQATFPLISPILFGIFTPNFTTKVRKIWLNFWYQNRSGFVKNWGMMLWIMSDTFKLHSFKHWTSALTYSRPLLIFSVDIYLGVHTNFKIATFSSWHLIQNWQDNCYLQ